jgi:hypothetical protein
MKTRHLHSKIGAVVLGFSIVIGLGIAMSTSAQAQSPWNGYAQRDRDQRDRDQRDRDNDQNRNRHQRRSNDDYPNWGGSFQLRQTALNAGYNEGIKDGRNDRNKRKRFNFHDSSSYQKATKDYNSRDGDRELYRRYFRAAFENGYDAGYNGY